MDIVIENDPYRASSSSPGPTYLRSPLGTKPPFVSSNSAFYYATLPRGGSGTRLSAIATDTLNENLTGASVRRVDKSGLLEIVEPVLIGRQSCPRHLIGIDSYGTLSRRIERSALLESVPELPDQCHRPSFASEELLAAAATARSMVERKQHLLGDKTEGVEAALIRRVSFAAESQDVNLSGHHESDAGVASRSGSRIKFAMDEVVVQEKRLGSTNLSNIPDVIETHGAATPTLVVSPAAEAKSIKDGPEGERAEAEGCEHTAIESIEEERVSYKGTTHAGDNVQSVHVIILSEQL